MRTVKEISDLTGISVRTLHYYDEIGLLKPTDKSEAGYRLYDDKALETLQQILFFREFDIPLARLGWFCPVASESVKPYFIRFLRVLTFCLGASKIVIF